jgi:hypothetical protein
LLEPRPRLGVLQIFAQLVEAERHAEALEPTPLELGQLVGRLGDATQVGGELRTRLQLLVQRFARKLGHLGIARFSDIYLHNLEVILWFLGATAGAPGSRARGRVRRGRRIGGSRRRHR